MGKTGRTPSSTSQTGHRLAGLVILVRATTWAFYGAFLSPSGITWKITRNFGATGEPAAPGRRSLGTRLRAPPRVVRAT